MKTLLNTYCVIETDEHVKAFSEHQSWVNHGFIGDAIAYGEQHGDHDFDAFDPEDLPHRTLVTVEQYIDMMTDRITPWRLEEAGFAAHTVWTKTLELDIDEQSISVSFRNDKIDIEAITDEDSPLCCYITTFSELQTLIKFLTPKP